MKKQKASRHGRPRPGSALFIFFAAAVCIGPANFDLYPVTAAERTGPVFCTAGRSVSIEYPSGGAFSQGRLISNRQPLTVDVPINSAAGITLDLPADLPPDYFDLEITASGDEKRRARLPGALRVQRGEGHAVRVVVISDIHADETVSGISALGEAVEMINLVDPDLVLCQGDMMTDPDERGFAGIKEALDKLTSPVFYCAGNHDHRDVELFKRYFSSRLYYSFDAGNIHFIVLDTGKSIDFTSRRGEGLDAGQIRWLQEDLESSRGKAVYILMHHSPVIERDSFQNGREDFKRLAAAYDVRGIFAGHLHRDAVLAMSRDEVEIGSFPEGDPPVIHTTTLSSARLKGKDHGFRLIVLSEQGIEASTPFESLPRGSLYVDCTVEGVEGGLCFLTNRTAMVIPGVRIDAADGGKGADLPGRIVWSGSPAGKKQLSLVLDVKPGRMPLFGLDLSRPASY